MNHNKIVSRLIKAGRFYKFNENQMEWFKNSKVLEKAYELVKRDSNLIKYSDPDTLERHFKTLRSYIEHGNPRQFSNIWDYYNDNNYLMITSYKTSIFKLFKQPLPVGLDSWEAFLDTKRNYLS